jgi:hypothetical protein
LIWEIWGRVLICDFTIQSITNQDLTPISTTGLLCIWRFSNRDSFAAEHNLAAAVDGERNAPPLSSPLTQYTCE